MLFAAEFPLRPRRPRRWLRRGVLAVLPAALGFVALTAASVAYLRQTAPPTTAFMLRARYADPASGQPCDGIAHRWVARERISPHLRLAVVVAEDQRFQLHGGFDGEQIRKALREQRETNRLRGASTISQQVAKNLFLWPGGGYVRKGLEAWLTLWIEQLWTKQRILEVYLNVAQFGPCIFGADAAARRYFERPAGDLEPEQAALLATVLPNPARLRAWNPGPYASNRRDEILKLMRELGAAPHLRGL
jgi:monofunctional biosynthetic peptidoglycan transglycosylase